MLDARPALLVRTQRRDWTLSGGRTYNIGRDPRSDIFIDDSRVSWRHAVLRLDGVAWLLEDTGSTNGTFQGRNRVQQVSITGACAVRLGHVEDGPLLSCSLTGIQNEVAGAGDVEAAPPPTVVGGAGGPPAHRAPADPVVSPAAPPGTHRPGGPMAAAMRSSVVRQPSQVVRLPTTHLRIGRAPDNDVVVADLRVSGHHAELRRDPQAGYEIVDLGSHNGTFVNGQPVEAVPVTEQDTIGIGPATFRLVGAELLEFIDTGDISLIAQDLTVRLPGGKVLLDHVSFSLGERCLLGVIGPSGAGKSTLLSALTAIRPATEGNVFYDDRDLYTHYAELRHRIGLVPQENILHTQLTGRRALRYAAELRFPRDTSPSERNARVDEVVADLALLRHADTKTAAMSGGQQKRVNVALELLTRPSLLFLDEPTSGLDPGLDKSVMEQLSQLAHDGRTVIVVTHSVANLDLCDRLLVLVPGGRIAFFGTPQDGLLHFQQPGWAEVFQTFEAEASREWAEEFRHSAYFEHFLASPADGSSAAPVHHRASPPAPRTRNRLAQLSTLIRRYMAVIASDRGFLALLVGTPLVLAAIIRLIPSAHGLAPGGRAGNQAASSLLLILVIGACFIGALNSVREIVKERSIYSRERAVGLSAGAYLCSKLFVLGVISTFQAALIVVVGLIGRPLPPHGSIGSFPLGELILAVAMVAVGSMALGLLISALVSTAEKTMPLLFLSVMIQVILTGGVFALYNQAGLEQLAWFSPSRWGFGASASTVNLNYLSVPAGTRPPIDPVWVHGARTWLTDMALQVVLFIGYALITWWLLLRVRPGRRR